MFPIILTASRGQPKSFMRASSLAWSIKPKAFLKSMYMRYMSLLVSLASSRVAMIVCICLEVLCCGRKLFWLECNSLCCSPQLVRRVVMVLVYSLHIVFANTLGLQLVRCIGSFFYAEECLYCVPIGWDFSLFMAVLEEQEYEILAL